MADTGLIPGRSKARLRDKKWLVELIAAGPPLLAAGYGASMAGPAAPLLWGGVAWLAAASIWKVLHAKAQDEIAAKRNDHDGLVGALHVLQAAVGKICQIQTSDLDKRLRVTLHRLVPDTEEIEQVVPYVGGSGGGEGRRFSIRSGITGHAIRTESVVAGSREIDDEAAYIEELKARWSFTEKDAKGLTRGKFSSLAIPVLRGQQVVGVVYLDSDLRDLFTSTEIAEAIVAACGGINRYVDWRY